MPYVKIWIHFVWATKNRLPLLSKNARPEIFNHIKDNGKLKGIYVDTVNGYTDHVHCLVSLTAKQDVATIAQLLKGESSYWINKHKLLEDFFQWQDEYFAVSVSQSAVNAVRAYINNQESHHQKKTFAEEYDEFMNK